MANVNATTANNAAAAAPKLIGKGNASPEVGKLQQQLKELGYDVGKVDSKFGEKTEAALKKFQEANGIKPDGVLGVKTREKLTAATKAANDKVLEDAVNSAANKVSPDASKAAAQAAADKNKALETYGDKAKPAPKNRLEEQQEAAKNLLSQLAEDGKVAAIVLNPIFAPAALAIATKAQANAVVRYETEVPQKEYGTILAEEQAKARKEILGLPKAYAEFGQKAVDAVVETSTGAALAAYEWGADAVTTVAEVGGDIANTAWEGTKKGAEVAWEGTKTGAKAWWNIQTAPIRLLGWMGEKLGQGLSWFGNLLGGGSKSLQDVGK